MCLVFVLLTVNFRHFANICSICYIWKKFVIAHNIYAYLRWLSHRVTPIRNTSIEANRNSGALRAKNVRIMKSFWYSFQYFLGESKLPTFIVEILKFSGYDSAIALQFLSDGDIENIETFIEKAKNKFFLIGSLHENVTPFEFRPGHKALLLGLKHYAEKFVEKGLKKKENICALETIEEVTIENLEEESIKKVLLDKIKKFNRQNNISNGNLSNEHISESLVIARNNRNEIVYKCSVKCHLCSADFYTPCIYNKHWQISNLEKHIKTHSRSSSEQCAKISEKNQKELDDLLHGKYI